MKKQLVAALLASLAIGCIGCNPYPPMGQKENTEIKENKENKDDAGESTEATDSQEEQVDSQEEPAVELEEMTAQERAALVTDAIYKEKQANVMYSPTSLNLAIGMLREGTSGESGEQLDTFLGTSDYSEKASEIMKMTRMATEDTTDDRYGGYKSILQICNSAWINEEYTLKDEYKQKVESVYNAQIENVSFATDNLTETVDRINGWCNENTYEMIPKIITDSDVSPDTTSVLVNTVYFESPWVDDSWHKTDKVTEFRNIDGTESEVDFIKNSDAGAYFETSKFQAFRTRYANGLSFIGILPKKDNPTSDFNLSDIDIAKLLDSEKDYDEVIVTMPELNFETTADNLVDILKEQGITDIFDSSKASIDEMVEVGIGDAIKVDSIIQKTKIELDENGTKAAAATAIIMTNDAMAMPGKIKEIELTFDRPYAFMIYDRNTDEILFMGKVVKF